MARLTLHPILPRQLDDLEHQLLLLIKLAREVRNAQGHRLEDHAIVRLPTIPQLTLAHIPLHDSLMDEEENHLIDLLFLLPTLTAVVPQPVLLSLPLLALPSPHLMERHLARLRVPEATRHHRPDLVH